MKGYETADHLEADQADLAAAGEHQGVSVDDRGHRFGLGDLQRGEGGNVAAPGIRTLRARGGPTRAQNHPQDRPQDRPQDPPHDSGGQRGEKQAAAVFHGGDFRSRPRLRPPPLAIGGPLRGRCGPLRAMRTAAPPCPI